MTAPAADFGLQAGAAVADLTPEESVFLFGYPHVPRWSTGVHDRLEATALYLEQGDTRLLLVANDLIFVSRQMVSRVRERVRAETGVPAANIVLTATHTHSGPITVDYLSNSADPVVPKVDPLYIDSLVERITDAACRAVKGAVSAELALTQIRVEGIGTNRHAPAGPSDPEVPVLLARRRGGEVIACMMAYAMHTTVLHEDSTLISGDFPHFTKRFLRESRHLPPDCPILYHNGASGNQSPRHVTKANTFAEAQRLGELLGAQIAVAIQGAKFAPVDALKCVSAQLELTLRQLPGEAEAKRAAEQARARLTKLRAISATPRTEVRTAECDWFGAEESVALATAANEGRLAAAATACLPAEIKVIRIGPWSFVFWPGEFYVEYALQVKAASPNTFVVTMANGELQGYIVTEEAVRAGHYEAGNAVFDARNGDRVVQSTLTLLRQVA
jgi:neutral ceramidase